MENSTIKNLMRKTKTLFILISFLFFFLFNLSAASKQCIWTGIEKIVAVGDIHGDYGNFVRILRVTKLIDEELHWIGGRIHLVQTGDVLDRGPDAKNVFDLIMKLEKEAEEAGGMVHMLIGNHEMINITGLAFDFPGYVSLGQFVSFIPDKYRERMENEFRKKIGEESLKEMESNSSLDISLKNYWKQVMKGSRAQKEYTDNFNEKYGKWIIEHNTVIKINDTVFVHGGISEKFSKRKLENINKDVRTELDAIRLAEKRSRQIQIRIDTIYPSDGPLWYRELARSDEDIFKEDVDKILKNLDAKYMVIAHTPRIGLAVSEENMSRFQRRIWIIDTVISRYLSGGGNLSALIIENGEFALWGGK